MGCENDLPRKMVAEFLGTMGLIIAVIGSVMLVNLKFEVEGTIFNALVQGIAGFLVLFAMLEALGKISGGHFNPAVTLAMVATRETKISTGAFYVIAQILGGFVGVLLLNISFIGSGVDTVLQVSDNALGSSYLVVSEILCTFLLVAVVFGCIRSGSKKTSLAVAATVGGLIMVTASTFYANPAVDIARMFAQSQDGIAPLTAVYYIIAAIIGALIAAGLFSWLYPVERTTGN
ncbi:putative aquaporin AqpM [Candidatus Methanoplasma termitum]|uniref:AqpM protein n=1 Tax=Candidatus Methanoplasma termitum TaxID=1577791 RepID=A0A0A7LG97_9ARCH|nr:aquaporin [Candidatus Methanoplasma termitum]AIZ56521.1 putative aquaporin AqpM [Candidatus Methanoplasma termitum]MCL2334194.1 aquaporin [Candidatus Methanoplasma sp.]